MFEPSTRRGRPLLLAPRVTRQPSTPFLLLFFFFFWPLPSGYSSRGLYIRFPPTLASILFPRVWKLSAATNPFNLISTRIEFSRVILHACEKKLIDPTFSFPSLFSPLPPFRSKFHLSTFTHINPFETLRTLNLAEHSLPSNIFQPNLPNYSTSSSSAKSRKGRVSPPKP